MFLASRLDLATFSRFAFVAGGLTEYVVLVVVVRFVHQRGRRLADLGLVSSRRVRETFVGIGVGVLLIIVTAVGGFFLEQVLPSTLSRDPRPTWAAWVYGLALVTAFAPIEEIVWRGYAITTLRERLGSTHAAVIVASAAFALMHWWGGPATMVMSFVVGVALSVLYLRRRSLVSCIVAHFVLDLPLFLFMLFPMRPPGLG